MMMMNMMMLNKGGARGGAMPTAGFKGMMNMPKPNMPMPNMPMPNMAMPNMAMPNMAMPNIQQMPM